MGRREGGGGERKRETERGNINGGKKLVSRFSSKQISNTHKMEHTAAACQDDILVPSPPPLSLPEAS